jgi:LysR family transcriptional regulator, hydrogen peroxide-inducible genes activator
MEMHQIRYFIAVAETLNFTRAAENCNVTQPALTRAIQKLENELGSLMLHRERANTQLTDFGRLMKPHLEEILHETVSARTTAHSFLKLERAALNLGVIGTIGPQRFVSFLASFRARNPGIEISVEDGDPALLCEWLAHGRIEAAITAQPEPYDEQLRAQPLYRERFVIGFPRGHKFESKNAVRLADLHGECYLSRMKCEYRTHIQRLRQERGIDIRYVFRSERDDWIQTMVAAGLGFCVIPESWPVQPGVTTRPLTDPDIERTVSLATVVGRRFSAPLAAFVKDLKSQKWS